MTDGFIRPGLDGVLREVNEARRPPIGESYPAGGVTDGLIRPGLDGVLGSYGFATTVGARGRGRRA